MKKAIIIAVACLLCSNKMWADGLIQVDGKLEGANGGYVYLIRGGEKDSASVKNGQFHFKKNFDRPDYYTISANGASGLRFFVSSAGKLTFSGNAVSMATATVAGECVKDWNGYTAHVKTVSDNIDQLNREKRKEGLSADEKKVIDGKLEQLTDERNTQTKAFIIAHPNSTLSPCLIANMFAFDASAKAAAELSALYNGLGDKAKQSFYGKKLQEEAEATARIAVGAQAPAFTQLDRDGKEISLADYKGKYVILDFWGSWCAPCRKSHPHLVELYAKYKGENFDILGLAGNEKPENWTKAIEEDGMTWRQVNVKGNDPKQALLNLYHIRAFPTKILVDPNGVILLYCIGSVEEIDAKLKEVFGK